MKKNDTLRYALTFFVVLFLGFMGACSSHPKEEEINAPAVKKPESVTIPIETQQVAAEQKAEFVVEVSFRKGKSTLDVVQKEQLRRLLRDAKKGGSIKEVKIVSWADKEFPSVHTKQLSTNERKLADQRNSTVKDYLRGQSQDLEIQTYNMAERANGLNEFVGSSDARIKKSFEVAGIPTTDTSIKSPSKASKSIVMMIVD